ncbi:drug/metabolite transporter [Russula emetica]|nr:drug/metabolite transporter [Russula emetica]
MNICVKWLNSLDEPVPILELIWVRMIITYIGSVAYMLWRKIPDPVLGPKDVRRLLVVRGFTGFIGLAGMYFSLGRLSLSDATMLTFLTPILTGFSGAIFLKEDLSFRNLLSGLCSFFGVILIARPQFLFGGPKGDPSEGMPSKDRMQSVAIGLIGVLGATGAYTLIRAIGKRAHTFHSIAFFSFNCVLVSTLGMVLFKTSPVIPTNVTWLAMLLLIGILGLTSQTLLVMGLQRETASRATLAVYTSIVFAVMFEFIVFHTTPSALSLAGAAIIISSAIYVSLTKKTAVESATSPTRERPLHTNPGNHDSPQP